MSHEEEKTLDPERLFACNLRWTLHRARRVAALSNGLLPVRDAEAAAMLGLWEAATRWDRTTGSIFLSFARWRIEDHLRRRRAEYTSGIQVSSKTVRRILAAEEAAEGEPRLETVALDAPVDEADPSSDRKSLLVDEAPTPDVLAALNDPPVRRWMDACLDPLQCEVLRARFGFDGRDAETFTAVSKRLGWTPQRLEQVEKKALRLLRAFVASGKGVW